MGPDDVSSEPTSGGEAHSSAAEYLAVSIDARSAGRAPTAFARAGGRARALWLSSTDGAVETRRLASQCEAHLSALWTRRPRGAHEAAEETGQPRPCAVTAPVAAKRALEHGLRERTSRRWPLVSDINRARPLHAGVARTRRGPFAHGHQGRG